MPPKVMSGEVFTLIRDIGVPPASDLQFPSVPVTAEVACLDTYWFGWCLWNFPGPWRKRLRRLSREVGGALVDAEQTAVAGPETLAVLRSEASRVLLSLPEDVREVVALDALGYTGREVARELAMTEKTVEGRLRKARRSQGTLREAHDGAA